MNAQGEVDAWAAGIRTPWKPVSKHGSKPGETPLEAAMPEPYAELLQVRERLEQHYHARQATSSSRSSRTNFTMLQIRNGKRTAAGVGCGSRWTWREGLIDQAEAVRRVNPTRSSTSCCIRCWIRKAHRTLLRRSRPAGQPRRRLGCRRVYRR